MTLNESHRPQLQEAPIDRVLSLRRSLVIDPDVRSPQHRPQRCACPLVRRPNVTAP